MLGKKMERRGQKVPLSATEGEKAEVLLQKITFITGKGHFGCYFAKSIVYFQRPVHGMSEGNLKKTLSILY